MRTLGPLIIEDRKAIASDYDLDDLCLRAGKFTCALRHSRPTSCLNASNVEPSHAPISGFKPKARLRRLRRCVVSSAGSGGRALRWAPCANRKKPPLNGAPVRIQRPTRRDWRRIGISRCALSMLPPIRPSAVHNNIMPIARDYSYASQFLLLCVSAPRTRDNMSKRLDRSCDFLCHEERCILSKAAF